MLAMRDQQDLSFREIAQKLTLNGIATKTGKPWYGSVVWRILKRCRA